MIEIDGVSKRYGDTTVVDNVSMVMEPHRIVTIVGTSGSGKTTLLRMINRLVEPSAGAIRLDGTDNREVPGYELRRSIGYVIQGHGLFPHRTVAENIGTVPKLLGWDARRIEMRVEELMTLFQLEPSVFAERLPHELSGGQQQRVALARAIATEPEIVFFDEPTTGLDPIMGDVIDQLIRQCVDDLGATALSITHDMSSVRRIADRVAMIYEGRIIWAGPVGMLDRSGNDYVGQFIHGRAEGPIKMPVRPL